MEVEALEKAAVHALHRQTDATIRLAESQLQARHAEVQLAEAQLQDARRLALQSAAAVERADAGWLAGRINDEDHARVAERARSEHAAAQAQADQLSRHLRDVQATADAVDPDMAVIHAMGDLARALEGSIDHARTMLRRAFPEVAVRSAQDRLWLDLGGPEPCWIVTYLDDELGGQRAGEPVLSVGSPTTRAIAFT